MPTYRIKYRIPKALDGHENGTVEQTVANKTRLVMPADAKGNPYKIMSIKRIG